MSVCLLPTLTAFDRGHMLVMIQQSLASGDPLELHLTTSELWFGQEQEGILP